MSPSGCWGLPMALLALIFCPGSAEEFEVKVWPEQLVVELGKSQMINCSSTSCPHPATSGLETTLHKTLLAEQAQWKQFLIFNISQDTDMYCYFTCLGEQKSKLIRVSVFHRPKQVLLTLRPTWVTEGNPFSIECRVPAVMPLENFTLTVLRGKEPLHRQTFERATAAPQEVTVTHNHTARKEDGHYNFSCLAELDLRPRGGDIIYEESEPQQVKIYVPKDDQMGIIIAVVTVLLLLFVTSVLLCFVFGQQWHQRRRGSYGVHAAWRRLRQAYRA